MAFSRKAARGRAVQPPPSAAAPPASAKRSRCRRRHRPRSNEPQAAPPPSRQPPPCAARSLRRRNRPRRDGQSGAHTGQQGLSRSWGATRPRTWRLKPQAAVVSRRHAEIQRRDGQFVLVDLGSFNGTLLNDQRITTPTPLYDGDRIQLGMGGPSCASSILRILRRPERVRPDSAPSRVSARPRSRPSRPSPARSRKWRGMHTMVVKPGSGSLQPRSRYRRAGARAAAATALAARVRRRSRNLTIGRAPDNDVRLDGLQISNHHARFERGRQRHGGRCRLDQRRLRQRRSASAAAARFSTRDVIQIGPFVLAGRCAARRGRLTTRARRRASIASTSPRIVANRSGGGIDQAARRC